MIATKKIDRPDFITGLESIGKMIEEEVDVARRNKLEFDRSSRTRPG